MKLVPLMGAAFSMAIAHDFVREQYHQLLKDIKNEKFELLDVLHHLTSGMKSVFTQTTNDGLYSIRQSLGGAGYSAWSGIPAIIEGFNPCVTFEGDNTVMAMQSARYLQKMYKKVMKGKRVSGIFQYLNMLNVPQQPCQANSPAEFANLTMVS